MPVDGILMSSTSSLSAANLTGALPAIDGGALTSLPPHTDRTHLVYSGWNAPHNQQTGVYVAYPLDSYVVSLNTSYLTKSTNTFTFVNSGHYLFNVTTGALLLTLDNPNAYGTSASDQFGQQVSMSGNYAIVTASAEDDAGGTESGKAYIYKLSQT